MVVNPEVGPLFNVLKPLQSVYANQKLVFVILLLAIALGDNYQFLLKMDFEL